MIEVMIKSLPAAFEEFISMPQMDLTIPQNTVAMFLVALNTFIQNKKLGKAMIDKLKGPVPLNAHDESFLRDRFWDKPYLPMAYFNGATPQNNYTPTIPLTLRIFDDDRKNAQEGFIRLFLETTGADAKRPITLRKKDDHWYLWEYSSVLMGVRLPAKENPWG